MDSTEGEYILIRGGNWYNGGYAGVFNSNLADPRSDAYGSIGGRPLISRSTETPDTETLTAKR